MDGIDAEDIRLNHAFEMLPAQEESLWGGMEEKLAVTEQDPLLFVPRMIAVPLELQAGLQVSEQVDVATLNEYPIRLQDLRQAW